jgi:poly-gamma-glutamate capsule biosynthesis protein CapA/YwtB (metallophosphatase superfamily)
VPQENSCERETASVSQEGRTAIWILVVCSAALVVGCGASPEREASVVGTTIDASISPASPPSSPSATAAPATTTDTAVRVDPPLRRVTLAFTGDNLTHSPVVRQAERNAAGRGHDFSPMYRRIAPLISSVDLAVCHLETPIAPPGEPLSTAPLYGVPASIVDALAGAGYDRCSTASNHTFDRGTAGIDTTVAELERVGISQVGMARTPAEAQPRIVRVNDVRIAHLSYTFSYNGLRPPTGQEWRSNLIDPAKMVADALEVRRLGAEIVIVSVHDGDERFARPTSRQRDVARTLTEYGLVDLIVGHHAHVLQPIEQVNGRWVAYGLGNFISNMPTGPSWPASTQDGAVLVVEITERRRGGFDVGRPVVHPTWVDRERGWVIRPVLGDLADPSVPAAVKGALAVSLERTRSVVGDFLAPAP